MTTNGFVDFNNEYNYFLQYLYESEPARQEYLGIKLRADLAMVGKPSRNLYAEELKGNLKLIQDQDVRAAIEGRCMNLPEGQDFTIAKAIHNRAAQISAGVDTYKYQVNDPYMAVDSETEDLLAAKCNQDYVENKLEVFAPVFSTDISTYGVTAVRVDYDPVKDKNTVFRLNPKNIIWDPKYSSTGQERYRGYNTMISWSKLKKMIADNPNEVVNLNIEAPQASIVDMREGKDGKLSPFINKKATYRNRKIRSLNGLDVYVQDLNRLASAPALQGGTWDAYEFRHDLEWCYNLNYYQSLANDPMARTNGGYIGDDVELTVIYDMVRHIEAKIINRRYVISVNGESFHRFVNFDVTNPVDGSVETKSKEFTLDCPIKFQFERQDNLDKAPWPTSPIELLLDTHDKLCALRAKREHIVQLLSLLRITTNAGDAESLKQALNINGVILDDIQGDVQNIQFAYDWTAIDSQIAYYEQLIKDYLVGYNEFDAMQMMGDRASAAESGMAQGAIAQGLSVHQNAIMQLYGDIARQCIANRVVYSNASEFPITNNGNYSFLTIQAMALDAVINVIPKNAKKIQEARSAANALQILASMGKGITVNENGAAVLMEQALFGTLPRKMAQSFVRDQGPSPEAIQAAQLEGQNMADMLAQNNQMYQENPAQYEIDNVMQNNSPDDVDAIIDEMEMQQQTPQGAGEEISIEGLEMPMQEGAMTSNIAGQTPDMGSDLANPNAML